MTKSLVVTLVLCQLLGGALAARAADVDMIRAARQQAMDLRAQGRIEDCFVAFDEAANRASQAFGDRSSFVADIYFEEGITAFKADQYSVAGKCLNRALEINPNSAEVRLKLAELCSLKGNFDVAKKHLRQVLSHDPSNVEARAILASCYQKEGNAAKATKEYYQLHQIAKGLKPGGKAPDVLAFAPTMAPAAPAAAVPVQPAWRKPAEEKKPEPKPEVKEAPKPAAKPAETKKPEPKKVEQKKADQKKAEPKKIEPKPKKADAKKAAKKDAKKSEPKKSEPKKSDDNDDVVANSAIKSNTKLSSKAVLLTAIKGAKLAPVENSEPADTAEGESPSPKAKPKKEPPVAAAPKVERPKKPRPGFVPPPPPVPIYGGMMPVVPPPPAAVPPPVAKPKPKPAAEKPAHKEKSDEPSLNKDAGPTEADSDFLLEWGGKKKK